VSSLPNVYCILFAVDRLRLPFRDTGVVAAPAMWQCVLGRRVAYLRARVAMRSARVRRIQLPQPASLRDAGFDATLKVALGSASPGPCVALSPCRVAL